MQLVETPVDHPDALMLLARYFTSRELDFPPEFGTYTVRFPDPPRFTPPAGVFVVVRGDDCAALGCGGIRRLSDTELTGTELAGTELASTELAGIAVAGTALAAAEPAATVYEVKHIWLEPAARGQGWADTLMRDLEERARGFGGTDLVLDTNASLESAARLYARLGYESTSPFNDNPNATNWYRKRLG